MDHSLFITFLYLHGDYESQSGAFVFGIGETLHGKIHHVDAFFIFSFRLMYM